MKKIFLIICIVAIAIFIGAAVAVSALNNNKINILINCVCRACIPRRVGFCLVRRKDMYATVGSVKIPGLSVSDILIERERLILR